MGDVFLATDTVLSQLVALKLLNEQLATGEMRRRFEREVSVCAALRSSHIVKVIDYGISSEGYPFYVMEYLRGQTLGQLLHRERRLAAERTVRIVTQVCAGLAQAHQGIDLRREGAAGREHVKVIHRDLKPDNIFLLPTALGEFVKILDFGIAKLRREQISAASRSEQTHATDVFMGTYQYAAPEQIKVKQDLDERADIYSLGMILYEMLSGTDPYSARLEQRSEPAPSGVVWAVVHLTETPVPLRDQPGCEQLPHQLEAAVMRCLEKAPDRRFASVAELDQALRSAVPTLDEQFIALTDSEEQFDRPSVKPPVQTRVQARLLSVRSATQKLTALTTQIHPLRLIGDRPILPKRSVPWLSAGGISIAVALVLGLSSFGALALLKARSEQPDSQEAALPPASVSASPTQQPVAASSAALRSFSGHTDTIWTVAVSPDRQTLASGSFDKTIRLWNLRTGAVSQILTGHTDAVRSIAFSPDGQTFVSGSSDTTIKVWDVKTGTLIRTLSGHPGAIWSVTISPDSKTLASSSYDGTINVWNLQTGELSFTLPEYDSIWSVTISSDGKTLASGSYDGTIKIWNLQTGELTRTLADHQEAVRSLAISPDGQSIVSGSWDKTVKIWDLATGELRHTLSEHADRVLSVAVSPDGKTIASGSIDRTIKLWSLDGKLLQTLAGHRGWVISLAFVPPDPTATDDLRRTLVSGSKDRTIQVWQY
jgi:WD40 repeat protein/tRNA A-37 threonylcarbamoyl transferase component Bud32